MMACNPADLIQIPLFASIVRKPEFWLLRWRLGSFRAVPAIYRRGDPGKHAYVMWSGTTVDQDGQEVLVDEPQYGDFSGFASMLEARSHRGCALARRSRLPRSQPRRHHGAAGAKVFSEHGHANSPRTAVYASQQLVRPSASRNASSSNHNEPKLSGCEGSRTRELDYEVNLRAESDVKGFRASYIY